ncbi:MAG: nicotinate (nicotinamide) nucleotide adenylyltransferase [Rubricoccaceae bacterium]
MHDSDLTGTFRSSLSPSRMPLALFGGSFNPPHIGHLAVAEACADAAGLDRVLWMPAATAPHKQDDPTLASADARLAMVRLAIEGNPRFDVSDLEITRGGVSYTLETVRQLADMHPGDELALILGGDSLNYFPSWRNPRAILELARLIVYRRPGSELADAPDWVLERTTVVEGIPLHLSSTRIRQRIANGQTVRYLIPDAVRQLVEETGLYRL